jgi:hypothetical protein
MDWELNCVNTNKNKNKNFVVFFHLQHSLGITDKHDFNTSADL